VELPNPAATGLDQGNNPRGAIVQLIKSFGWKSIGGSNKTLKSPVKTIRSKRILVETDNLGVVDI